MVTPSGTHAVGDATRPRHRLAWALLIVGLVDTVLCRLWLRDLIARLQLGSDRFEPYAVLLGEAVLAAVPTFVGLILVLEGRLPESAVDRFRRLISGRGAVWFWASIAVLLSGLIAARVYGFSPITNGDEDAYAFQARLFATGRLSATPPPVPEAFTALARVIHDGRWFAMAFPGHPLILAPGAALGRPWLSVAVVSFCSVLAIAAVGRRLLGPTGGGLAAALAALSPHVLYMQGSLLSQPSFALALLVLILLTLRLLTRPGPGIAMGTGLAWAGLFLVRPPTAVTMGAAWLGWCVWRLRSGRGTREWLQLVGVIGLAGSVGVVVYYAYNAVQAGAWGGSVYGLGMRGDPMGVSEWRLGSKVIQTAANLVRFNFFLFGWPLSLLYCLQWGRSGFPGRELRILAASTVPVIGLYTYHFAGHYWYWHELYIPATLITAGQVAAALDPTAPGASGRRSRRALAVLVAGSLCAALFIAPFLNAQWGSYVRARQAVLDVLPAPDAPQLIVVRSLPPVRDLLWRRFNGLNDPDLQNRRLFAIDPGGDGVARLAAAFPDRALILCDYDPRTARMRVEPYTAPVRSGAAPPRAEGK